MAEGKIKHILRVGTLGKSAQVGENGHPGIKVITSMDDQGCCCGWRIRVIVVS